MCTLTPKYPLSEGLRSITWNTVPPGGLVQPINFWHYRRNALSDWSILVL